MGYLSAARAPVARERAARSSRKVRHAVVGKALTRLCRAKRQAGRPPAERDLHAIRIKAKHLRFVAEAIQPVCKKPMAKLAHFAKKPQTILGDHHDAIVALRHLREVGEGGNCAFVAGQLAEPV